MRISIIPRNSSSDVASVAQNKVHRNLRRDISGTTKTTRSLFNYLSSHLIYTHAYLFCDNAYHSSSKFLKIYPKKLHALLTSQCNKADDRLILNYWLTEGQGDLFLFMSGGEGGGWGNDMCDNSQYLARL